MWVCLVRFYPSLQWTVFITAVDPSTFCPMKYAHGFVDRCAVFFKVFYLFHVDLFPGTYLCTDFSVAGTEVTMCLFQYQWSSLEGITKIDHYKTCAYLLGHILLWKHYWNSVWMFGVNVFASKATEHCVQGTMWWNQCTENSGMPARQLLYISVMLIGTMFFHWVLRREISSLFYMYVVTFRFWIHEVIDLMNSKSKGHQLKLNPLGFQNVFDNKLLQNNHKSNGYVIWLVFHLHQSFNLCDILLDIFKSLQ